MWSESRVYAVESDGAAVMMFVVLVKLWSSNLRYIS